MWSKNHLTLLTLKYYFHIYVLVFLARLYWTVGHYSIGIILHKWLERLTAIANVCNSPAWVQSQHPPAK